MLRHFSLISDIYWQLMEILCPSHGSNGDATNSLVVTAELFFSASRADIVTMNTCLMFNGMQKL